jgi:hypothetical protein
MSSGPGKPWRDRKLLARLEQHPFNDVLSRSTGHRRFARTGLDGLMIKEPTADHDAGAFDDRVGSSTIVHGLRASGCAWLKKSLRHCGAEGWIAG